MTPFQFVLRSARLPLRAHRAITTKSSNNIAPQPVADSETHEQLHEGWQIRYRLTSEQTTVSGFAFIERNGQAHCELPIFEPQANALASIDLLREQCMAWITARASAPTTPGNIAP